MNDSSRSQSRRGKSARRVRVQRGLARRLGIEAMESRVLLSGTTLDPSIFGTDLTPASYATQFIAPVADSHKLALGTANVSLSVGTPVIGNEGGFTDAVLNNTLGTNVGTIPFYHTADDSNDNGFGHGIIVIGSGETNPGVVTNSAGGSLQSTSGGTSDLPFFADRDEGGLSGAISPRVITSAWNNGGGWTISTASEGGPISLASIRTEFSQPTVTEKAEGSIASAVGDRDANAGNSRSLADTRPWAANQLDGEWTRAIAMESASSVQFHGPADGHGARQASPDSAAEARGQEPVSAVDVRARGAHGRVDNVSTGEQSAESPDRLIGLPLSADRAAGESAATPVVLASAVDKTSGGALFVPAHRLEATGRTESNEVGENGSATHLIRDEVFSEWHSVSVTDRGLTPDEVSNQRLWVSPGPFLAVLALERFVRIDPKEKQAAQLGQSQRGALAR
jgi:hypothetical protein